MWIKFVKHISTLFLTKYLCETFLNNAMKYLYTFIGPCESFPCKNDGACSENGNSFICTCTKEYKGKTCEGLLFMNRCHLCKDDFQK